MENSAKKAQESDDEIFVPTKKRKLLINSDEDDDLQNEILAPSRNEKENNNNNLVQKNMKSVSNEKNSNLEKNNSSQKKENLKKNIEKTPQKTNIKTNSSEIKKEKKIVEKDENKKKAAKKLSESSEDSLFSPERSDSAKKVKQKLQKTNKTIKKEKSEPTKISKPKGNLVNDVLKRWWYCMEDWPPKNFNYEPLLREKKLRLVDFKLWKFEQEFDEEGFQKVYELEGYTGIFKNSKGEIFDLRPKESCPSFDNLKKKPVSKLYNLLIIALNNQIKELQEAEYSDPKLLKLLNQELSKAKNQANILNNNK